MLLSPKQNFLINTLANDPTLTELGVGGSGGGSKSFSLCSIAVVLCRKYPGIRGAICRKTGVQLRRTTQATLFGATHSEFGIVPEDFHFNSMSNELHYKNGSTILFLDLDTVPSDPDFTRLGSLELDFAIIDEAGEITLQAKNALKSRLGRGEASKRYNLTPRLFLSFNPSQNFLRSEYYDPYKELGGGDFQKWQNGYVVIDGNKKPAYRGFLRMSIYDNPFISENYIENLKSLPDRERRRLLDGDWDYADDDASLFKSGLIDKATCFELPEKQDEKFSKYIGVDLSDKGGDKTVFSLIDNGVLIAQKYSSIQMNWDETRELPMSRLIADELIEFAQRNGFTIKDSKHIAVECNGIGVGVRDMLKERGWQLTEYIATHKSRSQGYYQLMLDMDSGDIKVYHDISTLDNLRKQLMAHSYEMNNQEPSVVKKEKIKAAIGHSPDEADSFMIANWVKNTISNSNDDIRSHLAW